MRIAMVTAQDEPGRVEYVATLAAGLADRGHQVAVYAHGPGRWPDGPHGYELRRAPRPELGGLAAALRDIWARPRPDVVHAHHWSSGTAAHLVCRDLGVPVVQSYHGLTGRHTGHGGPAVAPDQAAMERLVGRRAAAVVAVSEEERQDLLDMGIRPTRLHLVPCGVDCDRFGPGDPRAEPAGPPRVLTVGDLGRARGHDDVVLALSRVPEAELTVVGGPPESELETDPDARRLRALAERFGVAHRVHLRGRAGRDELPVLLRRADIVACVPWYEACGVTALGAMASGTAVVAAAVGGLADTVVPGITGELVPPRRPSALAGSLRRLAADPLRRQQYAVAGWDRATSRYSWQRAVAEHARVYENVVDRPTDG
ncbi:MAG TPA: glycosyltransferase [Pseudonocardiaceae bacterium]